MQIEVPKGYESLGVVLQMAIMQAACGKGKERHASGEPFEQQKICRISRAVGTGFAIGQALKKAEEAPRLGAMGVDELLGAINYAAAGCIVMAENNGIVLGCGMSDGGADRLPKKATASEEDPLVAAQQDLETFLRPHPTGGFVPKLAADPPVSQEALGRLARRSPHQPEQCDD